MKLSEFYGKAEKQLMQDLPFVLYKKPGSSKVQAFFQENNILHKTDYLKSPGFIFSPFDHEEPSVIFPIRECTICSIDLTESFLPNHTKGKSFPILKEVFQRKENYMKLIRHCINEIHNSELQKVVISRKEEVPLTHWDPLSLFKKMIELYKNAFCYLWFHPKVGMWLGATPETLLAIKSNSLYTMALAGTQSYNGSINVKWGSKEVQEQQLVTNFITDSLKKNTLHIKKSKTHTHRAGSLLHLKTDINALLDANDTELSTIIKSLHPTPAVCGLPRDMAKSFIRKHEGYDRSFYTGFLGELWIGPGTERSTNLFVNLRCMLLQQDAAVLYVGGGITEASNPENEWEETIRKTATMKRILFS